MPELVYMLLSYVYRLKKRLKKKEELLAKSRLKSQNAPARQKKEKTAKGL